MFNKIKKFFVVIKEGISYHFTDMRYEFNLQKTIINKLSVIMYYIICTLASTGLVLLCIGAVIFGIFAILHTFYTFPLVAALIILAMIISGLAFHGEGLVKYR